MDWMLYIVASLFALLGCVCLILTILQLPGVWIMIALALVIELIDSFYLTEPDSQTFGWWLLGTCLALAVVGEVVEFVASAAGTKYGGGTRRGMIGAIVGGIVGALVGTPFIPPLGTLIGAILGSMAGAVIGETTGMNKMTARQSVKPAIGAAFGRIGGTLGKVMIGVVVWMSLTVAAFWPG